MWSTYVFFVVKLSTLLNKSRIASHLKWSCDVIMIIIMMIITIITIIMIIIMIMIIIIIMIMIIMMIIIIMYL